MEFFLATQLSVPLLQVMLLLAVMTTALLLGRLKLALLMNYVFTLFWGYVHNGGLFDSIQKITMFTIIYFSFGLSIVVLAAIGFLTRQSQS
jgi:uncharacterized membrane protein